MRVDVIWGFKSMEAGLGQQRRGVSLNLVGQSVAVVLPRLLLGMLLKPCGIWAHVSHKLPRGPGSQGLKSCLTRGKQAGDEDLHLLCSRDHPQPSHQQRRVDGDAFSWFSCLSWELVGQEDDAGVGEHPGGFAFGDGGESAKQGAVLPTLAPPLRGASPGAVPPFPWG